MAIAAGGLVLLTYAYAASRPVDQAEQLSPREVAYSREAVAAGSGRCAIHHARFGGQRAQLIKIIHGNVPSYVVMEVGQRNPAMRSLRSNRLKGTYGDAEHVWLGEFASADDAETFGAMALGLAKDTYYELLCGMADELGGCG